MQIKSLAVYYQRKSHASALEVDRESSSRQRFRGNSRRAYKNRSYLRRPLRAGQEKSCQIAALGSRNVPICVRIAYGFHLGPRIARRASIRGARSPLLSSPHLTSSTLTPCLASPRLALPRRGKEFAPRVLRANSTWFPHGINFSNESCGRSASLYQVAAARNPRVPPRDPGWHQWNLRTWRAVSEARKLCDRPICLFRQSRTSRAALRRDTLRRLFWNQAIALCPYVHMRRVSRKLRIARVGRVSRKIPRTIFRTPYSFNPPLVAISSRYALKKIFF